MHSIDDQCGPYCEVCGDCLSCYGGDPCFGVSEDGGTHVWPPEIEDGGPHEFDLSATALSADATPTTSADVGPET